MVVQKSCPEYRSKLLTYLSGLQDNFIAVSFHIGNFGNR